MKNQARRLKIYLAGGFRSGWQQKVAKALPNVDLLDPSSHSLEHPANYTEWDLRAIREADWVLANLEASNPGGYALALEVGYAKALGKRIILVEEHSTEQRRRYFEMVRSVADTVFDSLESALAYMTKELVSAASNAQ